MKDNKTKVLSKLFEKPEYHFHIRELARETHLNPNTIITIVNQLEKESLIIKKKYKHLVEVYCNYDTPRYKRKKQLFNIAMIQESDLLEKLIKFYNHPKAIILFGSFSRGEDWSNGDIDLAVISAKKEKINLSSFEKKLKRNIHLLVFDYKDISDKFYNNLINGFVLYGFLKDDRIRKISPRKKSKEGLLKKKMQKKSKHFT